MQLITVDLAAVGIVLIGVVTMIAWKAHLTSLLRIRSESTPMMFNTALALTVTGLGVSATWSSKRWVRAVPAAAGVFDLALAIAVLLERGLGWDLHIDQLVTTAYLHESSGPPGRMAANTAACFLATGVALLLWAPRPVRWRPFGIRVAGLGVLGVASLALFGHMAAIRELTTWRGTAMALSTATGMCLLGVALVITGMDPVGSPVRRGAAAWSSGMAGFLALACCGILWQALVGRYPSGGTIAASAGSRAALVMSALLATIFALAVWYALRVAEERAAVASLNEHLQREVNSRALAEAETRRRAAQLEQANRELERSNKDLTDFGYAASHDLAEPLRAISGPVALLARRYEGQLDEEADSLIHFAVDGCQRMQVLIDDLLAYSRVGRFNTEITRIDLNVTLSEVRANLDDAITRTNAHITSSRLPVVDGSAAELRCVLQNLLSNAIKFHAPNRAPAVMVDAQRHGGMWRVTVTDNGIGIEPEYRAQVFGMFKRLHSREEYSGTGIGLALVKKIVERHGGEVGVEPGPEGVGCAFWFTLPSMRKEGSA
jgi:signal transduction histidine kinase